MIKLAAKENYMSRQKFLEKLISDAAKKQAEKVLGVEKVQGMNWVGEGTVDVVVKKGLSKSKYKESKKAQNMKEKKNEESADYYEFINKKIKPKKSNDKLENSTKVIPDKEKPEGE